MIAGMPEDPENPWGVTPFRKVSVSITLAEVLKLVSALEPCLLAKNRSVLIKLRS